MTITVQELITKLQGFRSDAVIALKNVDNEDFYILSFVPKGNILNIVISEEPETEEEDEE